MNEQPYGDGWLVVIETSGPDAADGLLDAGAYRAAVEPSLSAGTLDLDAVSSIERHLRCGAIRA